MSRKALAFIFLAALLFGAAPIFSAAALPAAAQTSSSSTAAKKKKHATSKSKSKKSRVKGQTVPTPDRIKEIQSALQKDGSYEGEPTGKWDDATVEAMKKFQDKNGMTPSGKIDAPSLNKLGLGSQSAGRAAPTPSASATPSPSSPSAARPADSPSEAPAKP